jgi:hypothetical protein
MDNFRNKDVVDLADLNFDPYPPEGMAARLSSFVISFIDIDDFVCYDPEQEHSDQYRCSAGTGRSAQGFRYNNLSMALSALASNLAGFSVGRYGSCYLAECDYDLLVNLKTYIDDDFNPSSRMSRSGEWLHGVKCLETVIHKFENAYAKDHPEYLLKTLKRIKT